MIVVIPGHRYELENHGGKGSQVLQFIEKIPVTPGSKSLRTVREGTTNEEVLRVLVDRLGHLNAKMPCEENAGAINHCQQALDLLEKRNANRVERKVEGTHEA